MNSVWVDARKILITDRTFGNARPLIAFSLHRVREILLPVIRHGSIPVIQGFIGGTMDGIPTTLGRGASDDSATIFGNLMNAKEIQIWTDVCGFMTADPKIAPEAQTIPKLSYSEAAALSSAGAKVLHLNAIPWAEQKRIPIRILNTFQPQNDGTVVGPDVLAVNNSRNRSAAWE
jgi:aspartate kinase